MIVGLGFDLLEVSRVEKELARGKWLLDDGVFTPEEIRYCSSAKGPALRYAACFAAKEATLKAFGIPVRDLAMFREVELRHALNGERKIALHHRLRAESEKLGVRHIHLAIAQSAHQAGALVILEA